LVSSGGDIGLIWLDWVGFSWIGFDRNGTGFPGQFRANEIGQRQIEPDAMKHLGHFFAILAASERFRRYCPMLFGKAQVIPTTPNNRYKRLDGVEEF
jgi:hypothetical protein